MKLSQMFPSKYLQAEDLTPGQNTIVTIERVYPAAARDKGGDSEPEVKWMMRFREYRKPMSLWRNTAKSVADVLGTDDTDQWVGKQIAIYAGTYVSFGETKPCINVDKWRPDQIQKPAGTSLVIANDKRPVPKDAMERFLGHLKGKGKTWDDFLRWVKVHSTEALAMVFGVGLDEIPAGVLPAMKAFLDQLSAPPANNEVIDRKTGEVISSSLPSPPVNPAANAKQPAQVDEDDIPF